MPPKEAPREAVVVTEVFNDPIDGNVEVRLDHNGKYKVIAQELKIREGVNISNNVVKGDHHKIVWNQVIEVNGSCTDKDGNVRVRLVDPRGWTTWVDKNGVKALEQVQTQPLVGWYVVLAKEGVQVRKGIALTSGETNTLKFNTEHEVFASARDTQGHMQGRVRSGWVILRDNESRVLLREVNKVPVPNNAHMPKAKLDDSVVVEFNNLVDLDDMPMLAVCDNAPKKGMWLPGLMVNEVRPGSELDQIGLGAGDVILKMNNMLLGGPPAEAGDGTNGKPMACQEFRQVIAANKTGRVQKTVFEVSTTEGSKLISGVNDFEARPGGVLRHLGTHGLSQPWGNPHLQGDVSAFCSGGIPSDLYDAGRHVDIATFVGGDAGNELFTNDVPDQWFAVDLGAERSLRCTHYSVRHGGASTADRMYHWVLEGSVKGDGDWKVIQVHRACMDIPEKAFGTCTWGIDGTGASSDPFRCFRVRQTGRNSSGRDVLCLAGLELYGELTGGFPIVGADNTVPPGKMKVVKALRHRFLVPDTPVTVGHASRAPKAQVAFTLLPRSQLCAHTKHYEEASAGGWLKVEGWVTFRDAQGAYLMTYSDAGDTKNTYTTSSSTNVRRGTDLNSELVCTLAPHSSVYCEYATVTNSAGGQRVRVEGWVAVRSLRPLRPDLEGLLNDASRAGSRSLTNQRKRAFAWMNTPMVTDEEAYERLHGGSVCATPVLIFWWWLGICLVGAGIYTGVTVYKTAAAEVPWALAAGGLSAIAAGMVTSRTRQVHDGFAALLAAVSGFAVLFAAVYILIALDRFAAAPEELVVFSVVVVVPALMLMILSCTLHYGGFWRTAEATLYLVALYTPLLVATFAFPVWILAAATLPACCLGCCVRQCCVSRGKNRDELLDVANDPLSGWFGLSVFAGGTSKAARAQGWHGAAMNTGGALQKMHTERRIEKAPESSETLYFRTHRWLFFSSWTEIAHIVAVLAAVTSSRHLLMYPDQGTHPEFRAVRSGELVAPWVWQIPVRFVEFFESQFLYGSSHHYLHDTTLEWKASKPKPWTTAFYSAGTSETDIHCMYDLMVLVAIASSLFALVLDRFAFSACCRSVRVQYLHIGLCLANTVVLAWCTIAQLSHVYKYSMWLQAWLNYEWTFGQSYDFGPMASQPWAVMPLLAVQIFVVGNRLCTVAFAYFFALTVHCKTQKSKIPVWVPVHRRRLPMAEALPEQYGRKTMESKRADPITVGMFKSLSEKQTYTAEVHVKKSAALAKLNASVLFTDRGVRVDSIQSGSPLLKTRIQPGDYIVSVSNEVGRPLHDLRPVRDLGTMRQKMMDAYNCSPNHKVVFNCARPYLCDSTVTVKLSSDPLVRAEQLNVRQFMLKAGEGFQVCGLDTTNPMHSSKIDIGDCVVTFNGNNCRKIVTPDQLVKAIADCGEEVSFGFMQKALPAWHSAASI